MTRVKICGITNRDDAAVAVEEGADALGFILFERSPRYVAPEDVQAIVSTLPPFVTTVGVFVNESADRVSQSGLGRQFLHVVLIHGISSAVD